MTLSVELSLPSADPAVPAVRAVGAGKDWKFTTQLQDGELYYRTKLQGSLTITGDDFAWLYSQWERFSCCVEVTVNVFSPNCETGEAELFWPGYFLMTAVRWDFSACSAEVREILPRDGYDALFRVWEKPVNLLEQDPFRVPFTALYRDVYVTQVDSQGNTSVGPPDGNARGSGYLGSEHHYKQGIRLSYALDFLLTKTITGSRASFIPGITSSFYFAPINPVTGRKNLDKLLLHGSDAKRPVSVTPAVKMVTTLQSLLDDLKALHNVYYMLNPDTGHLQLEHYSWFAQRSYQATQKVTLNLLAGYPGELAKANNESVDLESLFGIEELEIANNSASFTGEYKKASVRYDEGCTVKDDKGQARVNTVTVQSIWTDLFAGYANPESVPDDSIFLCDIVPAGTIPGITSPYAQLVVASTPAEYPGMDPAVLIKIGTNGYQSAALLFIDYHRHGRSFTSGIVNATKQTDGSYSGGQRMAMLSTTNTRRQENIVIPICCTDLPINLDGYIKTQRFATGKLDKGTYDVVAETLTLDVVAGSRCQQAVVSPSDPGSECPPKGTILMGRNEQTYCDQSQEVVQSSIDYITYADGACGSYEEALPPVYTGNC